MTKSNNNEPKITFHHQPNGERIGELIKCHAETAEKIWIASAFMTKGGLILLDSISKNKCKEIKVVCGVWQLGSDLNSIKDKCDNTEIMQGRVFDSNDFHSKVYIFKENKHITIILGSANFTYRGVGIKTKNNEEIVLSIIGSKNDEPIKSILQYFKNIWDNRTKYSVKEYLVNNPKYDFDEKNDKPKSGKKQIEPKYVAWFKNNVNTTLKNNGQQTVLKNSKNYEAFDQYWEKVAHKNDHKWKIILFNSGDDFMGSLYKNPSNKKRTRFHFILNVLGKGQIKLNNQIKMKDVLKYEFDFENEICRITKT